MTIDIDAAKRLCAQATPGPWVNELDIFEAERGYEAVVSNEGTAVLFTSETEVEVHQPPEPWTDKDSAIRDARVATAKATQPMRDAAFIAAARTLLPQALTEIEELRGEVERLGSRQQELLATIVKVTNETPFPDEVKGWESQRAAMLAEVGTLRAQLATVERERDHAVSECQRLNRDAVLMNAKLIEIAFNEAAAAIAQGLYGADIANADEAVTYVQSGAWRTEGGK